MSPPPTENQASPTESQAPEAPWAEESAVARRELGVGKGGERAFLVATGLFSNALRAKWLQLLRDQESPPSREDMRRCWHTKSREDIVALADAASLDAMLVGAHEELRRRTAKRAADGQNGSQSPVKSPRKLR
jgi:hypothetical protein